MLTVTLVAERRNRRALGEPAREASISLTRVTDKSAQVPVGTPLFGPPGNPAKTPAICFSSAARNSSRCAEFPFEKHALELVQRSWPFQLSTRLIGGTVSSTTVLIKKRPSRATSYSAWMSAVPPPTICG